MDTKQRNLNADFLQIAVEEIESGNYDSAIEFIEDVASNMIHDEQNMKGSVNTLYGAINSIKAGDYNRAEGNLEGVINNLIDND